MAYLQFRRESEAGGVGRFYGLVRRHWEHLLEQVPADCALCRGKSRGLQLCDACRLDVTRSMAAPTLRCAVCALALEQPGCPDCAARRPAFDRVIAAFDYAAPGDLLIQHFKARHRFSHARMFSDLVAGAVLAAKPALPEHTIMVPVPASRASLRRRGFNPAAEIARGLAPRLSFALRPELLVRAREGVRQTGLSRAGRIAGVERLYECPYRVEDAVIAVVDDVLTTGSTLDSIAREFKEAGAASVIGLVVARTPYSLQV
ncbi:ComF family protein [Paralcaligenes sp. KSB-10]|uniref:ComF family protein n=1 Tax=Paralcaligenes sp. KSB-10 TaxID=2901142 RepID=UPI001E643A60|nr:ComF family protein [Paralcaligenes sp. KSB-10]UHL62886.1 ComF family protein [Paralcaligenes sp. KSB-10]